VLTDGSVLRAWPADEAAWARECYHCGDSLEEIAAASGRSIADVKRVLGSGCNLTETERDVLSLYTAGCTFAGIDATRGATASGKSFASRVPGKAAASIITNLRNKGIPIPHRLGRRHA
jgi:hypothetical protein